MPQLILAPWFFIFFTFWISFFMLSPQKIIKHINLNSPTIKNSKTQHMNWTWPWL
uniref:ATP synthase complex subunit 8 n=1 Tax=Xenorhina sp. TNHC-GDC 31177 TaxID=1933077 RepID=A0A343VTH2_9NEOB|nr:ATP synthase subunit 8 [Xenorhina sp. TNHC-GDC 31177]